MSKLLLDFRVPTEYRKSEVADIVRLICNQVNSLSEGRIDARYQSHTAIPSGSAMSYAKGDMVWDSNPTVATSVAPGLAASYIRVGWICVAPGSPGTFKEMRVLVGT